MVELIEQLYQTNEISEEVKIKLLSKHYGNTSHDLSDNTSDYI